MNIFCGVFLIFLFLSNTLYQNCLSDFNPQTSAGSGFFNVFAVDAALGN